MSSDLMSLKMQLMGTSTKKEEEQMPTAVVETEVKNLTDRKKALLGSLADDLTIEPILDTSESEQTGSISVPRADPVFDSLGEQLSADMQATVEEIDIIGGRRAKVVAFSERKDELKEQALSAGYEDTDKYIAKELGPLMSETFKEEDSPILSKMFDVAPEWSYKALMGLNDVIQTGTSNYLMLQ